MNAKYITFLYNLLQINHLYYIPTTKAVEMSVVSTDSLEMSLRFRRDFTSERFKQTQNNLTSFASLSQL